MKPDAETSRYPRQANESISVNKVKRDQIQNSNKRKQILFNFMKIISRESKVSGSLTEKNQDLNCLTILQRIFLKFLHK